VVIILTSLDFLDRGQSWPPACEVERLQTYEANQKLFKGRHDLVFKDWVRLLRDDQQATMEIILNWHKRLSTLWADLLLGEPPRFTVGEQGSLEQDKLDELIIDNAMSTTSYEVAIDISRFGDGLFKLRLKEGKAIIEGQTPSLWFPVVSLDNVREIEAHVLAWTFDVEQPGSVFSDKKKTYLRVEIHRKGSIENRLYEIKSGEISDPIPLQQFFPDRQEEEATGIDDFLIIPVAGLRTTNELFGMDDYSDLESIIQELEIRASQISRILDKHSDPNMYGPESAVEIDPVTGSTSFKGGGRFFPVGEGEQPPGYVVWDGKIDAAFKQIEFLIEQLYIISETSAAAFGQQQKHGLAESGSALKRLLMAPLAKVNRIRLRFDPALKKVLQLAADLERANGIDAPEFPEIKIEWRDGLPEDPIEATNIEAVRQQWGIASKYSSLKRLDGGTEENTQEELDRIHEDSAQSAAAGIPGAKDLNLFSGGG
jgi:hypothetical protein